MPKRLYVEPHLSLSEIKLRYQRAQSPMDRRRIKVLWLIRKGMSTRRVAERVQMHPQSVREIIWRYNRSGPDSLYDKRHQAKGRPPLLNDKLLAELKLLLLNPPEDGGVWTGQKVAAWMSEKLGRSVQPQRGWDYLQRFGPTLDEDALSNELLQAVTSQEYIPLCSPEEFCNAEVSDEVYEPNVTSTEFAWITTQWVIQCILSDKSG